MAPPLLSPYRESFVRFVISQLFQAPKLPSKLPYSLDGRTGIIVGATTGIGYEAAVQFLELGLSTLIIGARNASTRGEALKNKLLASAKNSKARIEVWDIDLESYESIISFTERAERELPRIDFVNLSAAVATATYRTSKGSDDKELSIQVNVYAIALATLLFTPIVASKFKANQSLYTDGYTPAITIVNSDIHFWIPLPQTPKDGESVLAYYNSKEFFSKEDQYARTKLLELYFHQYFTKHILPEATDFPIAINAINPGLNTDTDLIKETTGADRRNIETLRLLIAWKPAVGARTYIDAAVIKGKASHGKYLDGNNVSTLRPQIINEDGQKVQKAVWNDLVTDWKKHGIDYEGAIRKIQAFA